MMSCFVLISYYVLINRVPTSLFGASHGLQQGDPLSSYLFIIMVEGLGRLLKAH